MAICKKMRHSKTPLSLLFLLFLLGINQLATAQQTGMVTGTITDDKGQPAAQATIGDSKEGRFTTAESNGIYKLILSTGKHRIACSMVGYQKQEIEITVSEGSNAVQDFKLKKAEDKQLQDVVVAKTSVKKQILPKPTVGLRNYNWFHLPCSVWDMVAMMRKK